MPDRIKILDASLAAKIAAGEVVDRPASVVKELIENSIDAGAGNITVVLAEGGKRLIKVVDDGSGMSRADAVTAFLRHATSKVSSEKDLERILTLGFRGEALASISAVSRVRLRTRERGALGGTSVAVTGGAQPVADDDGAPEGTSVEVDDLFYNLPARLKFLRSAQAEYGRALDVFKKAALINPAIGFTLMHGQPPSSVIDVKRGTLRERVAGLFPDYKGQDLTNVNDPLVSGVIGSHTLSFSTAKCLYIFVNKRPVRDKAVTSAVLDGYGTILDNGRYPFAVLNITVPPEDVDVNIHPAKTEVRFKNQRFIYDAVKAAVRSALGMETRPVRPDGFYSVQGYPPKVFSANETTAPYKAAPLVKERSAAPSASDFAGAQLETAPEVKNPELLGLRPVGQLWGEFLVAESHEGYFYVIDQHGAEERCAYERLKKLYMGGGGLKMQLLLLPERFEATPEESDALTSSANGLLRLGFEVIPFGPSPSGGGESFLVKSVPDVMAGRQAASLVKDIAGEIAEAGRSSKAEGRIEATLMRIACHSVIRGAVTLSPDGARALLAKLANVDFALYCPHGRPVVKKFLRKDIEAMFKR